MVLFKRISKMLDFLSLFDTRTTVFLVAIAFFIQANAIGAQAFLIRTYPGVGTALLGNLSIALGFFLNTLLGTLPDWITIVLANFLLLQGPNLFQIAFGRFLGQSYNKRIIFGLSLATLAILIYFTFNTYNVSARIIGASFCIGTSIFIAVYKLWKARMLSYKFSIWLTMIPLAIYGLFLYIRIPATIIDPPESNFSNTPFQTATFLLLFVISFLWTLGFILMVSQRLQSDLWELANTDTLTRIPNRHATQNFLEKEFARIKRKGGEFSVLLIDIDNFKLLNDTYGHAIGDQALIRTAKVFASAVRKQDIAGRWGGEEFLMILPDTSTADAQSLAERLRINVSIIRFDDMNLSAQLTISIGIASSQNCQKAEDILKKADDALYTAKSTKNTIETST